MMRLQPGANTKVILTLNESKTLESPEYVIVFVEQHTKKKVACKLGTDNSTYPDRNNKFTITVTDVPDPEAAEVSLKDKTHYFYVYEMADASAFDFENVDDLDLDTMTGEVENGICKYETTPASTAHYKNTAQSVESYGD